MILLFVSIDPLKHFFLLLPRSFFFLLYWLFVFLFSIGRGRGILMLHDRESSYLLAPTGRLATRHMSQRCHLLYCILLIYIFYVLIPINNMAQDARTVHEAAELSLEMLRQHRQASVVDYRGDEMQEPQEIQARQQA